MNDGALCSSMKIVQSTCCSYADLQPFLPWQFPTLYVLIKRFIGQVFVHNNLLFLVVAESYKRDNIRVTKLAEQLYFILEDVIVFYIKSFYRDCIRRAVYTLQNELRPTTLFGSKLLVD
ncbi:hypothetical protein V8G54_019634, partial [Vigna mungo]